MSSEVSETPSGPVCHRQPVINPGMGSPLVDSRRQLSVGLDQPTLSKTKRKGRSTYEASASNNDSDASIVSIHPQGKKKKKVTGSQSSTCCFKKKDAPKGPADEEVSTSLLSEHLRKHHTNHATC
ncbi:uncharacterized protein MELLADRAFT_109476 [Melampsora larici-populina 98AG31]|uniref:Uncharacterized protein n=1 Tax=Melampsora larici-populina (strain 98AG31 / pathotype 3-4-7) TaxID=747676 RepID=F4RWL5_MELLP|nr:uncharacterized protein MELLADRAFT_109476 [Melampsora larici-populina 98AG31]EGG03214.1 hypothetical protein MELLADRAFT_109476 [Melampsora larici-populina 98AG31]